MYGRRWGRRREPCDHSRHSAHSRSTARPPDLDLCSSPPTHAPPGALALPCGVTTRSGSLPIARSLRPYQCIAVPGVPESRRSGTKTFRNQGRTGVGGRGLRLGPPAKKSPRAGPGGLQHTSIQAGTGMMAQLCTASAAAATKGSTHARDHARLQRAACIYPNSISARATAIIVGFSPQISRAPAGDVFDPGRWACLPSSAAWSRHRASSTSRGQPGVCRRPR